MIVKNTKPTTPINENISKNEFETNPTSKDVIGKESVLKEMLFIPVPKINLKG
tara:strand:- start:265 stop:423 length:159 start_codon:yes stop_codon:yes gene_type:complete